MLIAGNTPTGGYFQNPRSRNLGPPNKGNPTPKYTQTNTNGGGVLLFAGPKFRERGPKFRERGFWNAPPVGTFPSIKLW